MSELNQVYKCSLCQQMVSVIGTGAGSLTCCGQPMGLVKENSVDAAKEKHVPVIVKEPGGFKVSVGSVTHPSEEKHYIEWIELVTGGVTQRRFLKPGDKPEATFSSPEATGFARAYCNLHGLWKS